MTNTNPDAETFSRFVTADPAEAQKEVFVWITETFGQVYNDSVEERCNRFIEEALEAVQAAGMTKDQALAILDHVYSRPKDPDVSTEIGGAYTTLMALASSVGVDVATAYLRDVDKRWTNQAKIQEKERMKQQIGIAQKLGDF